MSNDKMVLTKEDIDLGLQGVKDMITTMVTEKYADKKEKTLQDVIKRMARIVDIEGGKYGYTKEDIDLGKEALLNGYFLPGGSILSGLKPDTKQKSSLSNCYVMKIPSDSIEGIFQGMCEMARTYSYRGGCGVDITILRPNGEPVSNTAKHSTGAVSFMPMISSVTETIGQCLAEDSRVLTRRGLLMIKDVVVGDYAWTRIGWVLVLKIIKNKKQLYRITTKYGYSIRASKDHVFEKVEDDSFVETPVKHFTPGDEISLIGGTIDDDLPYARLTSNTFTPTQVNGVIHGGYLDVTIPIELTERLAYLVGFSYGNGSVTYTNGAPHALELAVGHAYPEVEEKLISYIKEIFGVNAPVRPGDGAVNRFPMGRHEVCSFLQENGLLKKKAEAISIPELIYVSPASVKMAFLSGYFDADGYNSGSKKGYAFSTISKKMAQEVQMLLWSMDIAATIHPENRDHLGWSTLYTVTVTGKHSQQLFINYATESLKVAQLPYVSSTDTKRTPFSPKHLRMDRSECCSKEIFEKRAPLHVARTNNNMHLVTTALVDSIVSIEEDEFGDTYDLQLADEHLFWCDGFYAHNSGRRGAALISIDITHPDIMRFIWCKADPHRVLYKDPLNKTLLAKQIMPLVNMLMSVTEEMSDAAKAAVQAIHRYTSEDGGIGSINGANISIRTSRKFMEAVRDDAPWVCYFPDIDADKDLYNREWNGDYEHWASVGGTLKKYTTYTACITRDNTQYFEGAVLCNKDDKFNTVLTKEHIDQLLNDHGGTFYGTFEIPSARNILKNIAQASWLRGDPGILFWDHMCEWSTVYNVHEDLKFRTTNPCFSLESTIAVADGKGSRSLSSLIADGKDVPVYTRDAEGNLCIKMGRNPRVTGYAETLTRVHFDNGSYQDVTHNHEFDLQSGETKRADELKPGDSLFPLTKMRKTDSDVMDEQEKPIQSRISVDQDYCSEKTDLPLEVVRYSDGSIHHHVIKTCEHCQKEFSVLFEYREQAFCSPECSDTSVRMKETRHANPLALESLPLAAATVNHRVLKTEVITYNSHVGNITVDDTHTLYTMTRFGSDARSKNSTGITEDFINSKNCGELSLSWGGCCALSSHILSKYVCAGWTPQASFNWIEFKKYCKAAVILLNIFIDINCSRHPLEIQRRTDKFGRRIGIEFTAFADMLSMLNLDYGDDEETLRFVEMVMYVKAITELQTSVELAQLQGPCDALDESINPGGRERFLAQPYVQFLLNYGSLCSEDAKRIVEMGITVDSLHRLQEDILQYGLRNTGFNCVGPTGSLSVLSNNCSSGIEPIFALSYRRRTRIGDKSEYTMCHAPLLQHLKDHQLEGPFDIDQLKEDYHIVEAHDLDYKQRIAMQSTVQRYHDGSISSTVNLPETCTPDEIMGVYMTAWYEKLKGITVYRAGSLDGVIITNKPIPSTPSGNNDKQTTIDITDTILARGELIKLPAQRPSITHEIMWGGVKMYAVVSMDNKGNPMELFINLPREVSINKDGVFNEDDYQSKMSMWMALTRMISMTLRLGGSVSLCMKQMKKASFAINDPMSVITRVLGHYDGTAGAKEATENLTKSELEDSIFTSICPNCNEKAYVREAGCSICRLCNYTKCD